MIGNQYQQQQHIIEHQYQQQHMFEHQYQQQHICIPESIYNMIMIEH